VSLHLLLHLLERATVRMNGHDRAHTPTGGMIAGMIAEMTVVTTAATHPIMIGPGPDMISAVLAIVSQMQTTTNVVGRAMRTAVRVGKKIRTQNSSDQFEII
jgi:hypothetical protein